MQSDPCIGVSYIVLPFVKFTVFVSFRPTCSDGRDNEINYRFSQLRIIFCDFFSPFSTTSIKIALCISIILLCVLPCFTMSKFAQSV